MSEYPIVAIVDDDQSMREQVADLVATMEDEAFGRAEDFLSFTRPLGPHASSKEREITLGAGTTRLSGVEATCTAEFRGGRCNAMGMLHTSVDRALVDEYRACPFDGSEASDIAARPPRCSRALTHSIVAGRTRLSDFVQEELRSDDNSMRAGLMPGEIPLEGVAATKCAGAFLNSFGCLGGTMGRSFLRRTASFGLIALLLAGPASKPGSSQTTPSSAPAVGVVEAARRPVTESYEFMGRVQARDRVELIARVPAFLEEQFFTEGAEVKKGDLLYRLEQPPYQADLEAKQAAIAQAEAQLKNAEIQLDRATKLLNGPAGTQMRYDDALTEKLSAEAKLRAAQAAAHQSQINLDYTEIRAPVQGRISRTSVTIGNVVGPNSGALATVVSQDPMYVTFPVPTRTADDLRNRYVVQGGFNAVAIQIRLPDGRMYGQPGTINFADVTISPDTDTLTVRGTIPNPVLSNSGVAGTSIRELTDGEFVTVVVESLKPVEQLTVPREAVLSDQRGDFVYVVDANNIVERRAVQLGQSTSVTAAIAAGLTDGERVVLEGVQRVQPGVKVAPGPADVDSHVADVPPTSRN